MVGASEMDLLVKLVHEALGGDGWAYTNYGGNELVTERDRLEAVVNALRPPPAVAAGGVTEALDAAREWINASGHAEHCFTNDPNPDACRCVCGKDSLIELIDDAVAALAVGDEGIREVLRDALRFISNIDNAHPVVRKLRAALKDTTHAE